MENSKDCAPSSRVHKHDIPKSITRTRARHRCLECQTRRIKCDMLTPCSRCVQGGRTCIPPDNSHLKSSKGPMERRNILAKTKAQVDRLEEIIEQLVCERGTSCNSGGPRPEVSTIETRPEIRKKNPMVEQRQLAPKKRPVYTSSTSWMALDRNEGSYLSGVLTAADTHLPAVDHLPDLTQPHSFSKSQTLSDSSTTSKLLLIPATGGRSLLAQFFPSKRQQMIKLIKVFTNNVDPFIRIIHKPSFWVMLDCFLDMNYEEGSFVESSNGPIKFPTEYTQVYFINEVDSGTTSFKALIFAVMYAATVSLEENTFQSILPESFISCRELTATYYRATELALSEANFMSSECLVTLEALTIFLSVGTRDTGARKDLSLLGLAIRIAQGMGLHRDGSAYGLRPIEIELRRRIWTKLRFMDVKSSEEMGCEPSIGESSYDTLPPQNIDDNELSVSNEKLDDLSIKSSGFGSSTVGTISHITRTYGNPYFTEMTFSLLRYEIIGLLNEQFGVKSRESTSTSQDTLMQIKEKRRKEIDDIQQSMEEKYNMKQWNMSDPIQCLAMRIVTTQLAKAKFLVAVQPWDSTYNLATKTELERRAFADAIHILEETIALREETRALKCQWSCTQFHATALVLFQLARGIAQPNSVYRAWHAIDHLYGTDNFFKPSISSELKYAGYCACVVGNRQDIPEDLLSKPLKRLLEFARIHSSLEDFRFASENGGNLQKEHVNSADRISELGALFQEAPAEVARSEDLPATDLIDDAFMDWIQMDGWSPNKEIPFAHNLRFSAF